MTDTALFHVVLIGCAALALFVAGVWLGWTVTK